MLRACRFLCVVLCGVVLVVGDHGKIISFRAAWVPINKVLLRVGGQSVCVGGQSVCEWIIGTMMKQPTITVGYPVLTHVARRRVYVLGGRLKMSSQLCVSALSVDAKYYRFVRR